MPDDERPPARGPEPPSGEDLRGGWEEWARSERESIRESGRWRSLRPLEGGGPRFATPDGLEVVSFASNDYLGLSQHPDVKSAAAEAVERLGTGTGSSRLIVGDRPVHHLLERALADWRGTDSALVFPSGYQANVAAMTTFGAGARIVSDEFNHASLIDGARLSKGDVAIYRHCDIDHARSLVSSAEGRAVVVSDSVFSMGGDIAPVAELSEICAHYGSLLMLDDAHSVFPVDVPHEDARVVRIGTLSKTLGSQGGYIAGRADWIELLVNRARSFIFTTGLAPASAAAALEAVRIYCSEEGSLLRKGLRQRVDMLHPDHPSPIVPIILGSEELAVAASENLLNRGLLVPAIRPPTVPPGTSRLRVSLSAAHDVPDVARLCDALARLQ